MNDNSEQESNSQPDAFMKDVISGLTSDPKYLDSKYLYDTNGDKLFQEIMASPDYYLTDAELEIFRNRCREMLSVLGDFSNGFDLIELGAGDALKSKQLIECLDEASFNFTYFPIDISENVIKLLTTELPRKIPMIKIHGIRAEYFEGLKEASDHSQRPKLVLFLGGNIGNMPPQTAEKFLTKLAGHLNPGDLTIIGFDLKKNPWTIFNAYNDSEGITKEFNLNLLKRINRELGANFDISQFEHYESYDPQSGACNSYLISLKNQEVDLQGTKILFDEYEHLFVETSHKYTLAQIDSMAEKSSFDSIKHLFDSKKWFTDVIWRKK